MGLIGVGTKAGSVGSAAHQLAHDEITDGIFVVTDDEDGLAHLDPLQHGVDDQRFHGQTHERIQCRVQVKDEAGRHHHEQVGEEKGYGDAVDVGVFFHDEGNDVRAARGSTYIEEQGRGNGRQSDGEQQVQHGLVGEGAVHGEELFQEHQLRRHDHRGIACGHGKFFAQKDEAHHQQDHVGPGRERRGREGGQLCHQSCRTGHTAKDEVIGEFEEIHTNAHDGDAQGDDRVLADVRHDLFPLIVFHTVFPFSAPAGRSPRFTVFCRVFCRTPHFTLAIVARRPPPRNKRSDFSAKRNFLRQKHPLRFPQGGCFAVESLFLKISSSYSFLPVSIS